MGTISSSLDNLKKLLRSQYLEYVGLFLLILICTSIRIFVIQNYPYGVEGDEFGWTMTAALQGTGITPDEVGLYSLYKPLARIFPISILFEKLSFLLFGFDIISPRKMLVFVTAVGSIFYYKLLRQFTSPLTSLITTALFYMSTYKILLSVIAFQTPFMDPFVWGSIYFAWKAVISKEVKISKLNYFLSGLFISLTFLTYNVAYLLLPSLCVFFIAAFVSLRTTLFKCILNLCFFFLPIFISGFIWLPGLVEISKILDYAASQSVVQFTDYSLNLPQLTVNAHIVYRQLFVKLFYENNDMIIQYENTLIPREISILGTLGFLILMLSFFSAPIRACFVSKQKYLPGLLLVSLLVLNTLPNVLVLGTLFPRMWFINTGIIFLFFGVFLQGTLHLLSKTRVYSLGIVIILVCASFLIYMESQRYFEYISSRKQLSFFDTHRDIFTITKSFSNQEDTLYIYKEDSLLNLVLFPSIISHNPNYFVERKPLVAIDYDVYSDVQFEKNDTLKLDQIDKTQHLVVQKEVSEKITSTLKERYSLCTKLLEEKRTFNVFSLSECSE